MFDPVEFLRQQTRLQHAALEQQGVFAGIVQPDVRLDDYGPLAGSALAVLCGGRAGLVQGVVSRPENSLYWPRMALLAADMRGLEGS